MPLLSLPNEVLLQIARYLLRCANCQCDHLSPALSAFSRCNHRLHVLLAQSNLSTSSISQMLLWAIANSRTDIVALSLERGADPNAPLRLGLNNRTFHGSATTPVELAIRMRAHSPDADSHALKLRTLSLLLNAGGTCKTSALIKPASYGDLDLLTLCLPRLILTDDLGPWTLITTAAHRGHVEVVRLAIAAGASVGEQNSRGYIPPLWRYCNAPIEVVQVLLDAGADPTWRDSRGVSVVQNMRGRAGAAVGVEEKIALLVRYGGVDEPPISLLAAGPSLVRGFGPRGQQRRDAPAMEYRGWVSGNSEAAVDWPMELVLAQRQGGCACLSCQI